MDFNYPDFTLASYTQLLARLRSRWHILRVCDAMQNAFQPQTLILRHDLDLSPALALRMADIERSMGVQSTYFAALHLHYNPHLPLHADALRHIAAMGHEIGLHYDGNLYPGATASVQQNLACLDRHIHILEEICGRPVVSIARHNPSLATQSDPLQSSGTYHNAYDERLFRDTIYMSDSCGAWRRHGLKPCWQEPRPQRVYLLIHPEQWGETTAVDRMAHFDLMRARAMAAYETFFEETRSVWRHHEGGKEHDERLRLTRAEA